MKEVRFNRVFPAQRINQPIGTMGNKLEGANR